MGALDRALESLRLKFRRRVADESVTALSVLHMLNPQHCLGVKENIIMHIKS